MFFERFLAQKSLARLPFYPKNGGSLKLQGEFAQGAPAKQPAMDKEEHKELMMKMYKRQEELKKLHEDAEFDQDSYLDSQWADPNAMKNKLQGLSHIKGL